MHVLGLPPAFTLSQDQTLHLKLRGSEEPNVLSAELVPGTNYSLAFLHLNHLLLCYERLLMDSFHRPDVRTSYLRTLSKICRIGLSASPLFRSTPPHQSARGSRTSYSDFQGRQHLVMTFLTAPRRPVQPLKASRSAGRALCTSTIRLGRGKREIFSKFRC